MKKFYLFVAAMVSLGMVGYLNCEKIVNYLDSLASGDAKLDEFENNKTVKVKLGSKVTVTLCEESDKNLKWVINKNDGGILHLKHEIKFPDNDFTYREFTFVSKQLGTTNLEFAYGPYTHEKDQTMDKMNYTIITSMV